MNLRLIYVSFCALGLAACSTVQPPKATPLPQKPIEAISVEPMIPVKPPQPYRPPKPQPVKPALTPAVILERALPARLTDRNGWKKDILVAFQHMKIPQEPAYFCAVMAVAEQESGFQADPVVANLPAIVWKEIQKRREKYGIPQFVVETAMLKTSQNGQTYKQRINGLRTERQMSLLFDEMVAELPFGKQMFSDKNPVRTGGPMQVSVTFAEQHVRQWPYPYKNRSLRYEVFSRRGGIYFGTAHLLHYPAPYPNMKYRFADFNAGQYSSRNAAFQSAVSILINQGLDLDGDLMRYENGVPVSGSSSERALLKLASRLQLSPAQIHADLRFEKHPDFSKTELWRRVFILAEKKVGYALAKERFPDIILRSPKITRKLTTEWFASRVDARYRTCLERVQHL